MAAADRIIVCGTDFSVHAEESAAVAAAIAKRLGARLLLVHAIDPAAGRADAQLAALLQERASARLDHAAKTIREHGTEVEAQLLTGPPYAVLTEVAKTHSAWLLVVSSLGTIAPSRFLVGSVAERTAQSSPVPTLVVRGPALESWASGKKPLNIFVAYDFSATADAALAWAAALCQIGPCNITVGYAVNPAQESWRLGGGQHWLGELAPELRTAIQRDLTRRTANVLGANGVDVRIVEAWGRPEPHILQLAKESNADLVIVGTHRRGVLNRFWLGSVSRAVLHDSPLSVVVVPATVGEGRPDKIPEVKRILVPTDFSELASLAVPQAYAALARGGTVRLLHVLAPKSKSSADPAEIKSRLQSLIPLDADARGIETELEVAESSETAAAICQAAERFAADWICIGSHGRTGVTKTLFGSVAQDILGRSKCPVLVVRPPR